MCLGAIVSSLITYSLTKCFFNALYLAFYFLASMSAPKNCSLCLQRVLFFFILGFRYVEGLLK